MANMTTRRKLLKINCDPGTISQVVCYWRTILPVMLKYAEKSTLQLLFVFLTVNFKPLGKNIAVISSDKRTQQTTNIFSK